jgi:hypothetical protein
MAEAIPAQQMLTIETDTTRTGEAPTAMEYTSRSEESVTVKEA